MTVGGALLSECRRVSAGHVFQPFGRLLRSSGADIERDVRFAANLLEEVYEFVRSERVRLDHAAPVGIERSHSPISGPDPLTPVVFAGETATRPANVGDLERLQRGNNVVADAARIRDSGIWTNPNPPPHAFPHMCRHVT